MDHQRAPGCREFHNCAVNSDQTILVIEDDPSDQFFVQEALRMNGTTNPIQLVGDGRQAVAYLKGEGEYADRARFPYPMFIITDLKMPIGADGFMVLGYLKSHPELGGIPAVVLSASRDRDDIQKAYLLGAGCYLVKPGGFADLRARLKVVCDYWMGCELPKLDPNGKRVVTSSVGKLAESFGRAKDFG